ncbi:hypothetical protein D7322_07250 [Sphingobacterium puteale]|uniref:Thioredoxin domain-containing protein n=1 Tax=Sphingobacterium puteale TaxID=2420510 RepID=A0A420W1X6_9SPHI|nr:hypothetical protein [Sphingobacterium puteale]RKO72582.1 hypothetical protein D7322_07250 [Sphingobacterium puteale]
MLKLFLLIIISFLSFNYGTAQIKCASLLKKKFGNQSYSPAELDSLIKDFSKLTACGLDSVALEIATSLPGVFNTLITPSMQDPNKLITYSEVFNKIKEFKVSPEYPTLLKFHIANKALRSRPVNLKEWSKDSLLFLDIFETDKSAIDKGELDAFYRFMKENKIGEITYYQAWAIFKNQQKLMAPPKQHKKILWDDNQDSTLSEVIQKAKEQNKRVILYFSGWTDITSRRLEAELMYLSDDKMINYIRSKFVFKAILIDDRSKLTTKELQQDSNFVKNADNRGAKNRNIQAYYTHSKKTPYFVMLDETGKILKSLSENITKNTLDKFLE